MAVAHGIGLGLGTTEAIAVLHASDAPPTDPPVLVEPIAAHVTAEAGEPADVVAHATASLLAAAHAHFPGLPADTGVVALHPARWDEAAVAAVRGAFDRTGLAAVDLVPDAVAAVDWLRAAHGPLTDGVVAVCDADAEGLTVSPVVVGAEPPRLLRPSTFSVSDLEATLHDPHGGGPAPVETALRAHDLDPDRLRSVLLTGAGATTPPMSELAGTLSVPVWTTPHPDRIAVHGAAVLAASGVAGSVPPPAVAATPDDDADTDAFPVVAAPATPTAFTEAGPGSAVTPLATGGATRNRVALVTAGVGAALVVTAVAAGAVRWMSGGTAGTPLPQIESVTTTTMTPAATTPARTTPRAEIGFPTVDPTTWRPPTTTTPQVVATTPPQVVATTPPPVVTTTAPPTPTVTTTAEDTRTREDTPSDESTTPDDDATPTTGPTENATTEEEEEELTPPLLPEGETGTP